MQIYSSASLAQMWKFTGAVVPEEVHLNWSLTIAPNPNQNITKIIFLHDIVKWILWLNAGRCHLTESGSPASRSRVPQHFGLQRWQQSCFLWPTYYVLGRGSIYSTFISRRPPATSPVITDGPGLNLHQAKPFQELPLWQEGRRSHPIASEFSTGDKTPILPVKDLKRRNR